MRTKTRGRAQRSAHYGGNPAKGAAGSTPSRDRVKRLFSVLLASYHGFDSQSRQGEEAFLRFIS